MTRRSATPMDVTELIAAIDAGDEGAKDQLFELVYDELRVMARREMRGERPDHTLQPTALVHETYTRLVQGRVLDQPRSREYVFVAAAKAMRQILIDHARERKAQKRGGGWMRICLEDASILLEEPKYADSIALHDALEKLEKLNERHYRLVVFRLIGLGHKEIAEQLNVSVPTVEKDWRFVKAWLSDQLSTGEHG